MTTTSKVTLYNVRHASTEPTVVALPDDPAEWMPRGACRGMDPDLFHPSPGEHHLAALVVCRRCTVRDECLAFAVAHNITHGVWGGTTPRGRRTVRAEWARSRREARA